MARLILGLGEALERAVTAHREGRSGDAEALCQGILNSRPEQFETLRLLAAVQSARGAHDLAIASLDRALALRRDDAALYYSRATALWRLRRYDDALHDCGQALTLRRDDADAYYLQGTLHHLTNRLADARESYRQALAVRPEFPRARFALCMAELPIVYADDAEIEKCRSAYLRALNALRDEIGDGSDCGRYADAVGASQPFYLAYQGHNDRDLQALYGETVCRIMSARFGAAPTAPPARKDEKIRIGIVSAYFSQHSNWKVPIKGWLGQLDRKRFRLFGYHVGAGRDAATQDAASLCERFVVGPLSLAKWRSEILADAPHVLLYPEIGMSGVTVGLAAQRLAAVQCNSWGHPETSGFPTIDYYLSSDLMEPSAGQDHYTERLVRLPNLSVYYEPLEPPPLDMGRANRGLRATATVYWCGQSTFKFLPQHDAIFPRIAEAAGDCQFAFIDGPDAQQITDVFRLRLEQAFTAAGLSAQKHCVFLPRLDMRQFVAVTGLCDVFLDPIGWSGCNTMLESLVHNLPIVTLPGSLMRARHGAGILAMMGVTETIARDAADYVALAVRLARDPHWRGQMKDAIAARKHRVYRDRIAITALEDFFEQVGRQPAP